MLSLINRTAPGLLLAIRQNGRGAGRGAIVVIIIVRGRGRLFQVANMGRLEHQFDVHVYLMGARTTFWRIAPSSLALVNSSRISVSPTCRF